MINPQKIPALSTSLMIALSRVNKKNKLKKITYGLFHHRQQFAPQNSSNVCIISDACISPRYYICFFFVSFFLVCLFLVRHEWVVLKRVWNSAPSTREILLMENAPCGSCYRTFPMHSEKQRAARPEKQPGVDGAVSCPSHDLHTFSTYLKNTQLQGGEEGRICLKASL